LEKQASKEWVLWNRELQQLGETSEWVLLVFGITRDQGLLYHQRLALSFML
jgi:hypothetical protein